MSTPSSDRALARAVMWSSHVPLEGDRDEAALEAVRRSNAGAGARRLARASPETERRAFRRELTYLATALGLMVLLWVTAGVL